MLIRIIVPNPPGGTPDLLARIIARGLQTRLKTTLIVENKSGASGLLATEAAVRSPADGYTLLMTNEQPITILPALRDDLPYDPRTALEPITIVAALPLFMVANSHLGVNSVSEIGRAHV